jgi:hypothetical protein
MPTDTKEGNEQRHALRYKPAIAVRAACEWLDAGPTSIEGEITDFSIAGLALQYSQAAEPPLIGTTGRVWLRLGQESHTFDVTLARVVRWAGGSWLAGLAFTKRRDCRTRAGRVIEHLKAAYRAGGVETIDTDAGPVAKVIGTLNFHVVISLHRLLRSPEPPRSIDLEACTGVDQSGIRFLLTVRELGVTFRLDPDGRIGTLIDRQSEACQAIDPDTCSSAEVLALQA